ncbi:hypothetical protein M9H77_15716 [Catharanthus roseus]|uniref:Uncharacterized protein n=1 Tax=Catharanthus roseus TaxID=4058 RepID=A0ACC0AXZ1_CATRO|nr:hypothetical protein M9H77_15716 [Catharanthus roseus]
MASFIISKNHHNQPSSTTTACEPTQSQNETSIENASVTSQLYLLKSSSSSSTRRPSESLDKEIVLRRIRHHKSMNKVRNALQSLLANSPASDSEYKWLELGDNFSSP